MRLSCLTALFASLLIALVAAPVAADSAIDDHLDDARSLYEAGHWDDAQSAFETAYEDAEDGTQIKAAAALEWGTLLWERGAYAQAKELVEESLALARDLELDEATGELLVTLGHIEASMGNLSSALANLETCIQLTSELGDDVHRSLCRLNRRNVLELTGQDPGSQQEFDADIETLGDAESARSTGASLIKTAGLYRDNGDFDEAEQLLNQAQQIYRDLGSVPGQARNQLRQAQLEHQREDFEAGRQLRSGLLDQFQEMGNQPMVIHTLALEAEDAIQQGELREGISHYRRALSDAEDIGNPQLTGRTHLALCELNFGESAEHCGEATELFESTGMSFLEIRARSAWGRTLQNRGDYEDARSRYHTAIEQLEDAVDTSEGPYARTRGYLYANLCQTNAELSTTGGFRNCARAVEILDSIDTSDSDRPDLRAATYHATGRMALDAERHDDAIEYLQRAAERYQQLENPQHQVLAADILLRLASVQQQLGAHRGDAPSTFQRGLELSHDLDVDEVDDAADVHTSLMTQLSQFYLQENDWDDAIEYLESLVEFTEEMDDAGNAAWAYSGLANAYLQTDRRDDAIEALHSGHALAQEAGDDDLVETFEENLDEMGQ